MTSYEQTVNTIRFSILPRYGKTIVEPKRLSGSRDNEENDIQSNLFIAFCVLANWLCYDPVLLFELKQNELYE